MPLASSSMMVKEVDLTGREFSEPPTTSSEPCRVTVSFFLVDVVLHRLEPQPSRCRWSDRPGSLCRRTPTSWKAPWSSSTIRGAKSSRPAAWVAPELGSNWTRTVVSTSPRVCRAQGGVGSVSWPAYLGGMTR